MSNIIPFAFKNSKIRIIQDENKELWFVLADVCKVLDITNPRNVTARLDDDEKNTVHLADGIRGNPNVTIINESELYSVVLRSDKPEAKPFKRWVTHEVLPSIRKTGAYSADAKPERKQDGGLEQFRKARATQIAAKTAEGICNRFPHLGAESQQTIYATLVNPIAGSNVVPLPKLERKTYSASEVADLLGVTANKIGRIANTNDLKTDKYGIYVLDKSRHSDKQVESFRYNDAAIRRIGELLKGENAA